MSEQYQSGPASLFSTVARDAHWVGDASVNERDLRNAKDFLKGKKVITTKALMEGLEVTELTAYRLMRELMQEGLVAGEWARYQSGFPVLKGGK